MIFGIWWGAWVFGFVLLFLLLRALYLNWEATKAASPEEYEKEQEAWRRSWEAYGPKRQD